MTVQDIAEDDSVVSGQIVVRQLPTLEQLECVDYMRTVFAYDANFPPGDPRDRDGA